ncbi:ABC transporter ATP-binding protein/permease [Pseudooceanicola onchidii]|uniref:ABC transporter ATP-binding protein/permease n=1 Tax=Pseudooceanicola onchidii TaxID=2562279 RepID=UPI0010AA7015|nr:ATP-binding cassette domain-containing protein [Pseudooceanicola onchidii]
MITPPTPQTPSGRAAPWGPVFAVLAGLVWPCQAAVIAWTLGGWIIGTAALSPWVAALAVVALTGLRVVLDAAAHLRLSAQAEARIAALREAIITTESSAADASNLGGGGATAALACEKAEALRPYLLRYRPARWRVAVVPPVILGLTAWHSWAIGVVLLVAGPLIPVFMALVGWAARSASERQMEEIGSLSDLLADRLAALADLRLIGAGPALVDGFADASDRLRDRTMAVLRVAFLSSTVLELFSALGVAMVAIWTGFTLLGELDWGAWGRDLSPAAGIYLLLLAPEFFQPLRDLAAAWHDKAAAEAVEADLARWTDQSREQRLGTGACVAPGRMPRLSTRNLTARGIRYPDIDLGPGQSLAITGPSGSGKTTLLRLLAGLEGPDSGQILLDGQPLVHATADLWRAQIGWMPQAPHFLNQSLRHNVTFGPPISTETAIAAQLTTVIARLPRADQTLLGARGAGLSGGEARRVTLARALHGTPGVILADEPTADLDAETSAAVTRALLGYGRAGGTLIVATHDMQLASQLDRTVQPIGDRP